MAFPAMFLGSSTTLTAMFNSCSSAYERLLVGLPPDRVRTSCLRCRAMAVSPSTTRVRLRTVFAGFSSSQGFRDATSGAGLAGADDPGAR